MNKKRLYRSSDAVFAGVCGGIAEYFGNDPTLVRIIAVALTIIGLGFPALIYVIFMIVLPPDPGIAQGYVDARAESNGDYSQRVYSSVIADSDNQHSSNSSEPVPSSSVAVSASGPIPRVADVAKNHSQAVLIVGAVLIGTGVLALLCNFVHISVWRFWPVVIVVVGVVCLFTPGSQGWSLERAGNAIVLISIGLVLLLWMLQIVQTRVFITAFWELWPVLIIMVGLGIIGNARKSSALSLASSLLFAATIIFGVWVFGGLSWENLGASSLLMDTDGLHEFLSDVTSSN